MIPHVIHRIWLGAPMPAHLAAYGDTWAAHHRGWEHVLWTEENMPPLRNQRLYDDAELIAPGNIGQLRSDIARYEILHTFGGVYVDADMECRRPIDDLLEQVGAVGCFAGWEEPDVWVNNAILGGEAGHPFLEALITGLPASVARHPGKRPNITTGPQYATPIYRRHMGSVTVFPKDFFYPYTYRELDRQDEDFPNSYAVHHWNNRRTNSR